MSVRYSMTQDGFSRTSPYVIAEDVSSDGQLRALERLECFGYLPSESFSAHSGRGSLFGAPTGIGGADLG